MQFGRLAMKRCRYGWMLYRGPYIGKCFELYGEYSESEVEMMRRVVRAGDVVVDVGANIGDLTLPLAQLVGADGRVYAIESHIDHFHTLCANLALNGIQNVKAINAFIADATDTDTASPVWGPHAFVSPRWAPSFVKLDELEMPACRLIKVDVDGRELEVLRSGEMQIERFRPVLYVENDVQEKSGALIDYLMRTLGYRLYWHAAPIFQPDNFFGNPVNHWEPRNIVSLMMLALPSEVEAAPDGLRAVKGVDDWWE